MKKLLRATVKQSLFEIASGYRPRNDNFPTLFTVNTLPEFQIEKRMQSSLFFHYVGCIPKFL